MFNIGASVLAEWLDNDADGCVDTPEVLEKLLESKDIGTATVGFEWFARPAFVFPDGMEEDADYDAIDKALGLEGFWMAQKVFEGGFFPNCIGSAATGDPYCRDEAMEEIWHGITDFGYALAFPSVFNTSRDSNSLVSQAMDAARGGKFLEIPEQYPGEAWYTNPTTSCEYECQVSEYLYWTVSSWVGANVGLWEDIKYQWRAYTRGLLQSMDTQMTAIIQDTSSYTLPSVSPTGYYSAPNTCAAGGQTHS